MTTYPTDSENWWLAQARGETKERVTDACLKALEPDVAALSDGFTTQRAEVLANYRTSRRSWIAYGLFFFPQTYMRMSFILRELMERGYARPNDRPLRVLDLGAGTGAAAQALADTLEGALEVTLVDTSQVALDLAATLAVYRGHGKWAKVIGDLRAPPAGPWDVILVSYALNEAVAGKDEPALSAWLERCAAQLAPDGILIVCEPATHAEGDRMAQLREAARKLGGWHFHAPCPHQEACPLVAAGRGPCHDVRSWTPPGSAKFLNRHLFRALPELKFGFLVLGRSPAARPAAGTARLVAPVFQLKGRWRLTGCADDGALRVYEVLQREHDAHGRHWIRNRERGDLLQLAIVKPLEEAMTVRASLAVPPAPAAPSP